VKIQNILIKIQILIINKMNNKTAAGVSEETHHKMSKKIA
jgi:hypothetical protein